MKKNILKALVSKELKTFLRQHSTEGIKVKPHIPLIQFRKGINSSKQSNSENSLSKSSSSKGESIDEFMIPAKYKRKSISQLEMDAIEQGGLY